MRATLIVLFKLFLALLIALMMAASTAFADDDDDDDDGPSPFEEFAQEVGQKSLSRQNIEVRLTPLGFGLMGDSVDSYSGRLQFSTTDVSLPGNSGLPVKITRIARGADATKGQRYFMSDWQIEVPQISEVSSFYGSQPKITIPGKGSEVLFEDGIDPHDHAPGTLVSEEPRWNGRFTSEVTLSHTLVNGLTAITTDGTEYQFNQHINRSAYNEFLKYGISGSGSTSVGRSVSANLATQVTDVNGNWVKYEYSPDGFLTRIHSNDGREITIDYIDADETKYISTVTANGRVWTYEYKAANQLGGSSSNTTQVLNKVIQPDGKYWEYNLVRLVHGSGNYGDFHGSYSDPGNPLVTDGIITVKHPYGTEATYQLGEVILDTTSSLVGNETQTIYEKSKAIYSKTLTLSDGEVFSWAYEYEHHGFSNEFTPVRADLRGTDRILTRPDGSKVQSGYASGFFGNGLLLESETYAVGSTVPVKNIENFYELTTHTFGRANINVESEEEEYDDGFKLLLTKNVITQDGDIFTTEHTYDTDAFSPTYSYHKPLETKVYSNISGSTVPRITIRDYEHLHDIWLLNLLDKATTNNREIASFDYDTYGRVTHAYRYGQLYTKYGYYAPDGTANSGNINWIDAALDIDNNVFRRTYAYDWKGGAPQHVKAPDNTETYSYVDGNGWMTSEVDAKGITTSYEYNPAGWVTKIVPHHNVYPKITRLPTVISYHHTTDGLVQHINNGYARETVRYDSLHRPFEEIKTDRIRATGSYINTEYDSLGRVAFKSFPDSGQNFIDGTDFTYDALGRILTSVETVGSGASTSYNYLNNNCTAVTDAEGNVTTTCRNGYGGAGGGAVISIQQPTDVATLINRNIFNEIESVTQSGAHNSFNVSQTQTFVYDDSRRLCRHYTPETGSTLYAYNDADEVTSHARVTGNGTTCAVPSGDTLVNLTYDDVGRPENTLFADPNTPDIFRLYDDNGNLIQLTRGVSTQNNWIRRFYNYDDYNDLEGETLRIREVPGTSDRIFDIDYFRNAYGHVRTKRLPSGRLMPYLNDGLGRPMRVGFADNPLAEDIFYHPTGDVSTMSYGNGQDLTQTLNVRRQVQSIMATSGSVNAVNLSYGYDLNGRILNQTDGVDSNNTRNYTYDDLGRLLTASSGAFGTNGAFTYDSLGNIRKKIMRSRTVTMSYDANNRLIRSNDNSNISGDRTLEYDARGNVTKLGNLRFIYDMANQPRTVYGQNAQGEDIGSQYDNYYVYDGNMKRVKSVVDGRTIFNVYDAAGKLVHVEKSDDPNTPEMDYSETDYVHANGRTITRIKDGVFTYLHPDHLGSAQAGTTEIGTVAWREHYTPFGETLVNDAANDDQAGFTGHIKDTKTGLNYMQARYYDPVIGRFLSNDPVSFVDVPQPGQFNRYAYCYNDPVGCTDPDGEFGLIGAAFGAVAGGVGAYVASGGKADFTTIAAGALVGGAVGFINPASASAAGTLVAGQIAKSVAWEAGKGALASIGGQVVGGSTQNFKEGQSPATAITNSVKNLNGGAVVGAALGSGYGKLVAATATAGLPVVANSVRFGLIEAGHSGVATGFSEAIGGNIGNLGNYDEDFLDEDGNSRESNGNGNDDDDDEDAL